VLNIEGNKHNLLLLLFMSNFVYEFLILRRIKGARGDAVVSETAPQPGSLRV